MIAEPEKAAENNVNKEKQIIDNKKLLVYNVAKDINGRATMLPEIQIHDFVSNYLLSNLSDIIPATIPESKPNTESITELINEY